MNGFLLICFWSNGSTWTQAKYSPPTSNIPYMLTFLTGNWNGGKNSITFDPYQKYPYYFTIKFVNSTRPDAKGYVNGNE